MRVPAGVAPMDLSNPPRLSLDDRRTVMLDLLPGVPLATRGLIVGAAAVGLLVLAAVAVLLARVAAGLRRPSEDDGFDIVPAEAPRTRRAARAKARTAAQPLPVQQVALPVEDAPRLLAPATAAAPASPVPPSVPRLTPVRPAAAPTPTRPGASPFGQAPADDLDW